MTSPNSYRAIAWSTAAVGRGDPRQQPAVGRARGARRSGSGRGVRPGSTPAARRRRSASRSTACSRSSARSRSSPRRTAWSLPGVVPWISAKRIASAPSSSIVVQRVDGVALRLRHLLAVRVADQARTGRPCGTARRRSGGCPASSSGPPRRTGCRSRSPSPRSGRSARDPAVSSGQPSVENGHRPLSEPGVEDVRVLGQLRRGSAAHLAGAAGPSSSAADRHVAVGAVPGRDPVAPPQLAATRSSPGCWSSSAPRSSRSARAGSACGRRASRRAPAAASGPVRTNHWVFSRGSMTSSLRWQRPMTISCGDLGLEVAARREVGHDPRPCLEPIEPVVRRARVRRPAPGRRAR